MINKLWLWGGAAAVAVIGGGLILSRGKSSSADTSGAYYPATVYGGVTDSGATSNTASSTDNSISQLIAANIATATQQSETTKYTSDNQKAVALATIAANQNVALDDNATVIKKSLADQVGNIISAFTKKTVKSSGGSAGFLGIGASGGSASSTETGPGSIVGKIGYENGIIKIDVAQGPALLSAPPLNVLTG